MEDGIISPNLAYVLAQKLVLRVCHVKEHPSPSSTGVVGHWQPSLEPPQATPSSVGGLVSASSCSTCPGSGSARKASQLLACCLSARSSWNSRLQPGHVSLGRGGGCRSSKCFTSLGL
jgi:hypothetical protein